MSKALIMSSMTHITIIQAFSKMFQGHDMKLYVAVYELLRFFCTYRSNVDKSPPSIIVTPVHEL